MTQIPQLQEIEQARCHLKRDIASVDSRLCAWAPRIFAGERLDLFMSSYMAMRRIDDQIDGLACSGRQEASPALAWIADWQASIRSAAIGQVHNSIEDRDRHIWTLLAATLPTSGFGIEPFERLARSLRHDAKGRDFKQWDDFWRYCEGATDAPTAIYLALMSRADSQIAWSVWQERAAPMGRFCYLAHIIRDLQKDALAGPHLLTLPASAFHDLATDRAELAAKLVAGDETRLRLVQRLLKPVQSQHAALGDAVRASLSDISDIAKSALLWLLRHYGAILQEAARSVGIEELRMPDFISADFRPI